MSYVAVLYGGNSAEREVSLRTGKAIHEALLSGGHTAELIDLDVNIVQNLKSMNPDIAFIALHGKGGEDGAIQGLLETLGIPYTGSGIAASAVAMNKILTKQIATVNNIITAAFRTVNINDDLKEAAANICNQMSGRLVVKAPNQGSTIGIYFVDSHDGSDNLLIAMQKAFQYDQTILIEKFVSGREVTASVLGNDHAEVLPIIEIVSHTGVYDYEAKYTKGLSDHVIPARISAKATKEVEDLSLKTYKSLFCSGLARVDFIIDEQDQPHLLEVNTIPGMTETSLFPDSARYAGIEFAELIDRIVILGLKSNR